MLLSSKLNLLTKAELAKSYLQTNATTHEFLFGALAEIIDNSRDANANNLHIYTEKRPDLRGGFILCFRDDGCGMNPSEAADVIKFGKSNKGIADRDQIGRYGNGLKSASMRIGKDLIILTKKDGVCSVLLMSQTFLDSECIEDIYVPMPSFNERNKQPWFDPYSVVSREMALEKHNFELGIIEKYSPFSSRDELVDYFDHITTSSGTIVIVYNMALVNGETELDIETYPNDIRMRDFRHNPDDRKCQMEHGSLRSYVTLLYDNPRMRIYIQDEVVRTQILKYTLFKPIRYIYTSSKFKNRALVVRDEALKQLNNARNNLKEADSELCHYQKKKLERKDEGYDEWVQKLTKMRRRKEELQETVKRYEMNYESKKRQVDSPKDLEFIFGINLADRDSDGLFIYNSSRLIIMHEPTRLQTKFKRDYRGIVGIVNVPYFVSEPTHNKQQFKEAQEQRNLISALSEHMEMYRIHLGQDLSTLEFWREFGYSGMHAHFPSDDSMFVKRRLQRVKPLVQCVLCGKWRQLRFHPNLLKEPIKCDSWTCEMNTDNTQQNCNEPEKFDEIPRGEYKKPQQETNFDDIPHEPLIEKRQMISQNSFNDSSQPPSQRGSVSQFLEQRKGQQTNRASNIPSSSRIQNLDDLNDDLPSLTSSLNVNNNNKRRMVNSDSSQSLSDDNNRTSGSLVAGPKKSRTDDQNRDPDFRPGMRLDANGIVKKPTPSSKTKKSSLMDPNLTNVGDQPFVFEASTPNLSILPLGFATNQAPMDIPNDYSDPLQETNGFGGIVVKPERIEDPNYEQNMIQNESNFPIGHGSNSEDLSAISIENYKNMARLLGKLTGETATFREIESQTPSEIVRFFASLSLPELERQIKLRMRDSIVTEINTSCTEVPSENKRKIIRVIKNKFN